MGIDRNVLVGRLGLRKTNLPETVSPPGASCAIHTSAPDTGFNPFDARACTGTVLDEAKLKRLIAAGQTKRELGTMEIYTRERSCTAASGCGAWSAPTREYGELRHRPLNATVSLSLERAAPSPSQYIVQYRPAVALAWDNPCPPYTGHCTPASVPGKGPLSCGGTPGPYEWGHYYRADNTRVDRCVLREGGTHGGGTLSVRSSCAQLLSSATRENSNAWTEYGYAGISRY